MTKIKGTSGGKTPKIESHEEEKKIFDFLNNKLDLSSLSKVAKTKFIRKASRFTAHKGEDGEWPKGEILLYKTNNTTHNSIVPVMNRIYTGEYRLPLLGKQYHDLKGHTGRTRTY